MAIGVFDSGVGGLTIYGELSKAFPAADIFYLGDCARAPYGNNSSEVITKYALEDASYLLKTYRVSALVVACNTISVCAIPALEQAFSIPVLGVVQASVESGLAMTKNKKLGVIATRATVSSGAYTSAIAAYDPRVQIWQKACPLLVSLAEEGVWTGELPRITAKMYIDELAERGIDTLILGCTHFPLLADVIAGAFPAIQLADGTYSMVKRVQALMPARESGKREVCITGTPTSLDIVKQILPAGTPTKLIKL
ncbi:glutamate racemase [Deferribacterales bacterium RsTz2092]|nr:glutamate racemase [Deferribacterales bacterium]